MRISDWSSDVCSSDLADAGSDVDLRQVKAAGLTQLLVNSLTVAGHDADVRVSGDRLLDRLLQRHSMSRHRQWTCQGRSQTDRPEISTTRAAIQAHASFPRHKTFHPIERTSSLEDKKVSE